MVWTIRVDYDGRVVIVVFVEIGRLLVMFYFIGIVIVPVYVVMIIFIILLSSSYPRT